MIVEYETIDGVVAYEPPIEKEIKWVATMMFDTYFSNKLINEEVKNYIIERLVAMLYDLPYENINAWEESNYEEYCEYFKNN